MENIKHIQIINNSLKSERKKFLFEITKVNEMIKKRKATIQKIISYQKEYSDKNNLVISRSIPALIKNLDLFSGKIYGIIDSEEIEVAKLEKIKFSIMNKLSTIDHKIKLMTHFEERAKLNKLIKLDAQEILMINDLSSTMHLRGGHE